jgi:hypothetical protein
MDSLASKWIPSTNWKIVSLTSHLVRYRFDRIARKLNVRADCFGCGVAPQDMADNRELARLFRGRGRNFRTIVRKTRVPLKI